MITHYDWPTSPEIYLYRVGHLESRLDPRRVSIAFITSDIPVASLRAIESMYCTLIEELPAHIGSWGI
jgi:hypothetical protein